MNRIRLAVATSIVAALMLSAGVAAAKPLSEAQWKKQANAVCKQVNKELNEIGSEIFAGLGENEEPSEAQLTAYFEEFAPLIDDAVASIDALEEPKALRSGVKKFDAAVSDALASIEADPTAVFRNDPFAKVDKVARKLGLKACS